MSIDTAFWCERVRTCFSMFLNNPETLQHMLLFGPPGSGKTTSANWLVQKIWKNKKPLMCISMNAADERSLESIRQKVFPFLRVDWRTENEKCPRFLILDECETLTEAAQLSLQTILNNDPKELCVILICNSQSRIHPKLRQRLLKIRYDPPNRKDDTNSLLTVITRGDLRQTIKSNEIEERIWKYLHLHKDDYNIIIDDDSIDINTIISEVLLIADIFNILDNELVDYINTIYSIMNNSTMTDKVNNHLKELIRQFKQKFEAKYA
jgi:DNA polymerase III delta prime subunit